MSNPSTVDTLVPDRAAITAVILGITAFAVAEGLAQPLISLVLASRHVPASLIGLNAAAFAFGLGAATLSISRLTAAASGEKLIIAGLLGASACMATFALTDALWIWFAARVVHGFCASLIFMLSEAWLNAASTDRVRGRVSGLYGGFLSAGFAAGPLAIPMFGTAHGFAFALAAVYVAVVAFITVILVRRTRTKPEPSPAGGVARFIRAAPLLVAMVVTFGFADVAAVSMMPVYFVRTGHSQAFAAISVTMMALPTALAQPLVGVLLDRVSRPIVAIGACGLAAASFLAIPFLRSEAALLADFALLGVGSMALYTAALTLLGESYKGGLLVAGSAAFSLAYAVGSAAGSTSTGLAMNLIDRSAGPICAGLMLTLFLFLFLVSGAMQARSGSRQPPPSSSQPGRSSRVL